MSRALSRRRPKRTPPDARAPRPGYANPGGGHVCHLWWQKYVWTVSECPSSLVPGPCMLTGRAAVQLSVRLRRLLHVRASAPFAGPRLCRLTYISYIEGPGADRCSRIRPHTRKPILGARQGGGGNRGDERACVCVPRGRQGGQGGGLGRTRVCAGVRAGACEGEGEGEARAMAMAAAAAAAREGQGSEG